MQYAKAIQRAAREFVLKAHRQEKPVVFLQQRVRRL
jgi:hypothetical protein